MTSNLFVVVEFLDGNRERRTDGLASLGDSVSDVDVEVFSPSTNRSKDSVKYSSTSSVLVIFGKNGVDTGESLDVTPGAS